MNMHSAKPIAAYLKGFFQGPLSWSKHVIVFTALVITMVNLNLKRWDDPMRVIQWDVKSYYAYLPAVFVHHDISLKFTAEDPKAYADKFWPVPTESGGLSLVMTMGLAMMYLPFFLLAHGYAWLSGGDMSGYSQVYAFALVFSALAWLLLGMAVLRRVLLRYFSEAVAALALGATVFGTNLLYYASVEAPMSHAYSFSLFSLFIWATLRWYKRPGKGISVFIGLLSGLIVLVRPTNIVILLFFILWDIKSLQDLKQRVLMLLRNYHLILLMGIMALLVWSPQLLYWKHVSGSWLHYSYNQEGFFFSRPQILRGLFSYRKGWLLYTPLMAFALAGIPLLWRYLRAFFWPVLVFTLLNTWVVFSWWTWWYGGGFGQRPLIESYALLAFPLALVIQLSLQAIRRPGKIPKRPFISALSGLTVLVLIAGLSLHSVFQTAQYYYGAIHWDAMSRTAYWSSFGRLKPMAGFYDVLDEPDYGLALQGIYKQPEVPGNYDYERSCIRVALDRLTDDRQYFVSDCGLHVFQGARYRDPGKAYTGEYSVLLGKGRQDALLGAIAVHGGESWQVSVKRNALWFQGSLIVLGNDPSLLYAHTRLGKASARPGWDSLSLKLLIPPEGIDTLKVYVHNSSRLPARFDELMLCRMP